MTANSSLAASSALVDASRSPRLGHHRPEGRAACRAFTILDRLLALCRHLAAVDDAEQRRRARRYRLIVRGT